MKTSRNKTKNQPAKDDVKALLKASLEKFLLAEGADSKIPFFINDIILISGLSSINDKKQAIECGRNQAQREMKAFENKAMRLLLHIKDMHMTSRSLLEYKGTDGATFSTYLLEHDLENLVRLCKLKEKEIQNLPSFQKPRPAKNQAQEVIKLLARIYKTLTGKKASIAYNQNNNKAEGKFYDFTKEIFSALGISDSPENQIKIFLEKSR